MQDLSYTATDYFKIISVEEYMAEYNNRDKFIALCKQCPNYGKTWACPPFSVDTEAIIRKYKYVTLIATKIVPIDKELPLNASFNLIQSERVRIQRRLLDLERENHGMALGFAGKCIYCADSKTCSRQTGEPCRHPELARPSLESFGFDISKTTSKLFDIPLLWGKNDKLPEYLTLVCGLFSNNPVKWL